MTDEDQTLQIPMYFTVSWVDDRLDVDQKHRAWQKSTTGRLILQKLCGKAYSCPWIKNKTQYFRLRLYDPDFNAQIAL